MHYTLPNGLPSGSRTVWSRIPLQPLVRGALAPFSYSILAEIAGRAWYQYFDGLGFDPTPRPRLLRQYQGCPYLNLTISTQRDAESAGIEPLTVYLDGQPFPVSKIEKAGLFAGVKHAIAQNRVESSLKRLAGDLGAITQQAQAWYERVLELRWTQAEVLQIMEEIETVGVPSFHVFFAARHNLDRVYNRLLRSLDHSSARATPALDHESDSLVEQALEDRLRNLGQMASKDEAVLSWLSAGVYDDWGQTAPGPLSAAMRELLAAYGHRCIDEGEICHPRWRQNPAPLFERILDAATGQWLQAGSATAQRPETAGAQGKEVQQLVQKMQQLRGLQSQALHAFAYVLAGARQWALAAARDAMVDQRLLAADDVFFFELEEMKQMMTGEWNVSDRSEIQAQCARRKEEFAAWQRAASLAPELLIGESEARPVADAHGQAEVSHWQGIGRLFDRAAVDG